MAVWAEFAWKAVGSTLIQLLPRPNEEEVSVVVGLCHGILTGPDWDLQGFSQNSQIVKDEG